MSSVRRTSMHNGNIIIYFFLLFFALFSSVYNYNTIENIPIVKPARFTRSVQNLKHKEFHEESISSLTECAAKVVQFSYTYEGFYLQENASTDDRINLTCGLIHWSFTCGVYPYAKDADDFKKVFSSESITGPRNNKIIYWNINDHMERIECIGWRLPGLANTTITMSVWIRFDNECPLPYDIVGNFGFVAYGISNSTQFENACVKHRWVFVKKRIELGDPDGDDFVGLTFDGFQMSVRVSFADFVVEGNGVRKTVFVDNQFDDSLLLMDEKPKTPLQESSIDFYVASEETNPSGESYYLFYERKKANSCDFKVHKIGWQREELLNKNVTLTFWIRVDRCCDNRNGLAILLGHSYDERFPRLLTRGRWLFVSRRCQPIDEYPNSDDLERGGAEREFGIRVPYNCLGKMDLAGMRLDVDGEESRRAIDEFGELDPELKTIPEVHAGDSCGRIGILQ